MRTPRCTKKRGPEVSYFFPLGSMEVVMILLCRLACLACLAVLAGIALAACSSGPGVAAPTEKDGAGKVLAPTLSLEVDKKSKSVSLSGVFTGASLEYSAVSSDKAVATAAIANGTLTITAHKAGPATITVTAKNAGGSAKYDVKVTVTKPNGAPTVKPGVKPGARRTVEFEAGDTTETIVLSSVFSGENLTYDPVTSNNPTVADARITNSNRSLTITARSTGSATITVTATNAAGNIAHSIRVTVPEPEEETTPDPPVTSPTNNPSDCKSPLTISRGDYERCTLTAKDHYLTDPPRGEVSVARLPNEAANVWTITAEAKGNPIRVPIYDNKANEVGAILVIVPNTPPKFLTDPT